MDTWDWIPFLRRRWATIGATMIAVVVVTMAVTLIVPPAYQSIATLSVQPITADNPMGFATAVQLGATSVGELVKSPNVQSRAARLLGTTPDSLGASLDYRVVEQSNLVEITAESGTPARAALVANAIARAYIDENAATLQTSAAQAQSMMQQKLASLRRQIAGLQAQLSAARTSPGGAAKVSALQDQIGSLQTGYQQLLQSWQNLPTNQMQLATAIQLSDPAQPNDSPVRPRPSLNLILSLVGGLFLGLAVARSLETARPTVNRDARRDERSASDSFQRSTRNGTL